MLPQHTKVSELTALSEQLLEVLSPFSKIDPSEKVDFAALHVTEISKRNINGSKSATEAALTGLDFIFKRDPTRAITVASDAIEFSENGGRHERELIERWQDILMSQPTQRRPDAWPAVQEGFAFSTKAAFKAVAGPEIVALSSLALVDASPANLRAVEATLKEVHDFARSTQNDGLVTTTQARLADIMQIRKPVDTWDL